MQHEQIPAQRGRGRGAFPGWLCSDSLDWFLPMPVTAPHQTRDGLAARSRPIGPHCLARWAHDQHPPPEQKQHASDWRDSPQPTDTR